MLHHRGAEGAEKTMSYRIILLHQQDEEAIHALSLIFQLCVLCATLKAPTVGCGEMLASVFFIFCRRPNIINAIRNLNYVQEQKNEKDTEKISLENQHNMGPQ